MLRGVSPPPTVPARQGSPASRSGVPGGPVPQPDGQVSVCPGVHRAVLVFAAIPLCNHLPAGGSPRPRGCGVTERRGSRSVADRGATPPCGRGREALRPRPGLRGCPCTGAGGGPAGVRTAFPFPLPAFLLGVQAPLCCLQRRAGTGGPSARAAALSLPGDGRSTQLPRHPRPFRPLDGAPRRLWGHHPHRAGHRRFKRRATPGDGAGRARPPGSPTWCGARVSRPPAELGAHGVGQPLGLACSRRRSPGGRSGPRPCSSVAPSGRAAGLHRRRVPR